jgi:hypothetical protein
VERNLPVVIFSLMVHGRLYPVLTSIHLSKERLGDSIATPAFYTIGLPGLPAQATSCGCAGRNQ